MTIDLIIEQFNEIFFVKRYNICVISTENKYLCVQNKIVLHAEY